ncbi:hypothetical protein XACG117_2200019 [Xanthomonas citri pv. citri]|nr:hypothetical protein XACG117_2200019 [Xanthomonas citri pv. citri]
MLCAVRVFRIFLYLVLTPHRHPTILGESVVGRIRRPDQWEHVSRQGRGRTGLPAAVASMTTAIRALPGVGGVVLLRRGCFATDHHATAHRAVAAVESPGGDGW